MTDFYRMRGGGRAHGIYATWPFAVVSVSADQIEFKFLFSTWVIPSERLTSLRRIRVLFSKGIAFEHNDPSIPPSPAFFPVPGNRGAFEEALRHFGFELVGTYEWPGRAF